MSDEKRYYWLQLKEDFFRQKEIKLLRRIAGGDTYTIIYQKMMLMSLKDGGKIYYEGIAGDFAEEIALEIDEELENVKITINYLITKGLLSTNATNEAFMNDVPNLIGSESDSARRVRKHRNVKQKLLQCNTSVTKCNTDIDIELDIELNKKLDIPITSGIPVVYQSGTKVSTDKTREDKSISKKKSVAGQIPDPTSEYFIKFWKEYPRKDSRLSAEKAFAKIKATDEILTQMLKKIETQKQSKQWSDKQFIPYPATWLNQKRWEDEEDEENTKSKLIDLGGGAFKLE